MDKRMYSTQIANSADRYQVTLGQASMHLHGYDIGMHNYNNTLNVFIINFEDRHPAMYGISTWDSQTSKDRYCLLITSPCNQ